MNTVVPDPNPNPDVPKIPPLTLEQLTTAQLEGSGVFDTLMRSTKAHLDAEYGKGRIKGPDYATVYLGSLEHVLQGSIQFLLNKDKTTLDSALMALRVQIAQVELEKAKVDKQKAEVELELLQQQMPKMLAEIEVLKGQKCKLDAEFDVMMETKLKIAQETQLLMWKVATEKAQTSGLGVDPESVVGKQMALYAAQASGFQRDAEQKVADIMTKTWSVRRSTDEGTVADATNKLDDTSVGRAVQKLLDGVKA